MKRNNLTLSQFFNQEKENIVRDCKEICTKVALEEENIGRSKYRRTCLNPSEQAPITSGLR